jgi:competence protein ComEC
MVLPRQHISNFVYYKNPNQRLVGGFISGKPREMQDKINFLFRVKEIQSGRYRYSSCGEVLVSVNSREKFAYGEELVLIGNLYRVRFKQGDSLLMMSVKAPFCAIRQNKNSGFLFKQLAFRLEERMEEIISAHVSPLPASVLKAMILGVRQGIPAAINDNMIKTGTVHILVVSGFNTGIVAFIIVLILKLLRVPRKARFICTIPCLLLYCFMTGSSPPVVRATIMTIMFLLSFLLKRELDIFNSLNLAAILILLFYPNQLFDIGFQLSFVSVFAIIYIYPRIKKLSRIEKIEWPIPRYLLEAFLVSLSAWLGTLGFIAYYFKIVSPVTALANLFVVPLATLVTLCGFSLVFISWLLPFLAPALGASCELAVFLLLKVNYWFARLPGAYIYLP